MRIIAGTLKGRQFNSPNSTTTHPMGDKIRGALFNILGDIEGLSVLDAFAGTGAIGFEAISRGAERVVVVESDRSAQKIITDNSKILNLASQIQVIATTATNWLRTSGQHQSFDLVILDPPYDQLQRDTLMSLSSCVNASGLLVLSWPITEEPMVFVGFTQIERRTYGDAQLIFYRRSEE